MVEDRMEGLKVLCNCGSILTSRYTFDINAVDVGKWVCENCGESYLIEISVVPIGESAIPDKLTDSPKKCVRLKCEKCETTLYFRGTNYINRLPKQTNWLCHNCGTVFLVKTKVTVGAITEVYL